MRSAIALAIVASLAAGCSSGEAGPQGQVGPMGAFPVKFVDWSKAGAATGNVTSMTVTAPAAGLMRVDAQGYCTSAGGFTAMGIETTAGGTLNTPVDHWFVWSGTAAIMPFSTTNFFTVPAGATTFYLVLSGAGSDCVGNMKAHFAATALP